MELKKLVSFFMVFVIVIGVLPITTYAATTIITKDEAFEWLDSVEGTVVYSPVGGYPGECASLAAWYYYKLLGYVVYADNGGTGHGKEYDDYNHSTALGWSKAEITSSTILEKGDIIVRNSGDYGHVGIYVSGSANNATTLEAGKWSDNPSGATIRIKNRNLVGWTYVRPNWKGGDSDLYAPIPDGKLSSTASTYLSKTNKNITFTYAGLTYADEVKINFKKDYVVYLSNDATKSRNYTTYFENPGHYTVYFTARYGNEWIKLEDMIIDIVEPVFSANKTEVDTHEEIVFTYDGLRYANKVNINFEKDGKGYFTADMTSSKEHKNYFEKEGVYVVYVTAKYSDGTVVSDGVKITVGKYQINYQTKCDFSINSAEKIYSKDIQITESIPVREHCKFLGWSTDENSNIVEYQPGDVYSENEDITLYAVWEELPHTEVKKSDNKNYSVEVFNIDNGCTVIFATYKSDKLVETQSVIYDGNIIPFTLTKDYDTFKVMVWKDFKTLTPLCETNSSAQ